MNPEDFARGLFAAFFEAKKGGARAQWMVFPPDEQTRTRMRFIKRRMDKPGHRAKWETAEHAWGFGAERLAEQLEQYRSSGWALMDPVVIRLEADDYLKAWADGKVDTPHKALRHVESQTKKRGYRLV